MIGKSIVSFTKKLGFYLIIGLIGINLHLSFIAPHINTCYWKYKLKAIGARRGTIVTFEEKLIAISHKIYPHKNPESLFLSRDFVWIYRHPSHYLPHVINLLNNPFCSEKVKLIAIYGMEKLDLDNYLLLLQEGIKLYQKGIISQGLLKTLLGFSLAECHPLIKYYNSAYLLDTIRSLRISWNLFHEIPEHITTILNGSAFEQWKIRKELPLIKKIIQDNQIPSFKAVISNKLSFPTGYRTHRGPEKSVESLIIVNGEIVAYPLLVEHNLDPLFAEIYFHPTDYMQEAISLLCDPSCNTITKKKIIYAMRRLPLKQHIVFFKGCCDAYLKNNISACLLMYVLSDFCGSVKVPPTIVEEYTNEAVQKLCVEIIKTASFPSDFRVAIQDIMSGNSNWIGYDLLSSNWSSFKRKFTCFLYGPMEYPIIDFLDDNITVYHSLYTRKYSYMYLYEDIYPTKKCSTLSSFISLKKRFNFFIREKCQKLF